MGNSASKGKKGKRGPKRAAGGAGGDETDFERTLPRPRSRACDLDEDEDEFVPEPELVVNEPRPVRLHTSEEANVGEHTPSENNRHKPIPNNPEFSPALSSLQKNLRSLQVELDNVELELKKDKFVASRSEESDGANDDDVQQQIDAALEEERAKHRLALASLQREVEKERRIRQGTERARAQEVRRRSQEHLRPIAPLAEFEAVAKEREEWKSLEKRLQRQVAEEKEKRQAAEESLAQYIRNSQQDPQVEALRQELREVKAKHQEKERKWAQASKAKEQQASQALSQKEAQVDKLKAEVRRLQLCADSLKDQLGQAATRPVAPSSPLAPPVAVRAYNDNRRSLPQMSPQIAAQFQDQHRAAQEADQQHQRDKEELKKRIMRRKSLQHPNEVRLSSV